VYKAIVIGSSAGGLNALKTFISGLPAEFDLPIIITQHLNPHSDSYLTTYLSQQSHLKVKEADPGDFIQNGYVYIAPPNMHLLVEEDFTLSLSNEEKINYSRPSIDILFETAARAYTKSLIGIILTGANHDGAFGIKQIKIFGGLTIAQNPETAEVGTMPGAAIKTGSVDHISNLEEIAPYIVSLWRSQIPN
jgi:two-component system chemotaxis response regulator CheB